MSNFRRRLILKNTKKEGIVLPSYDTETYPYNALIYGQFISSVAETLGYSVGYSFNICTHTKTDFAYAGSPNNWLWKTTHNSSVSQTWASEDGKTWTQIKVNNTVTVQSGLGKGIDLVKYYDTILVEE